MYLDVEIGGQVESLTYIYGTLDEVKRDQLVYGEKSKFYYLGNQRTQGIDIRLGKRTIATMQFDKIWKTDRGDANLERHNSYNDFTGELVINELERGRLSTINNKTDFNWDDENWIKVFTKLNEIRPIPNAREKTEATLREKWMKMLKATNPHDAIVDDKSVWSPGTRIDVYRETPDKKIIIYELKVGSAGPQHLYQLKMYWDGLILENKQPNEAVLIVDDFSTRLEEMANTMNETTPPKIGEPGRESSKYNFKLATHAEKGL